jgi:hypothetical protein
MSRSSTRDIPNIDPLCLALSVAEADVARDPLLLPPGAPDDDAPDSLLYSNFLLLLLNILFPIVPELFGENALPRRLSPLDDESGNCGDFVVDYSDS